MSTEFVVALISLVGVFIGAGIQWLIARYTIRAETERLHRQLSFELRLQQFSEWQMQFRAAISELIVITDPETVGKNNTESKALIISLILKVQLMLNPSLRSHARVNSLANDLALRLTGWCGQDDLQSLLGIHAALLEASRTILYVPEK